MTAAFASSQRGAGLLEPLIAIAILAFGLLGMAKFQLSSVAQTTDAQARLTASAAAEDLLAQLRIDLANAACYQVPARGTCTSPFARSQATAWSERAPQGLPGFVSAGAVLNANLFTVTLDWTAKTANESRTLTVTTDVRP